MSKSSRCPRKRRKGNGAKFLHAKGRKQILRERELYMRRLERHVSQEARRAIHALGILVGDCE